MYIGEKKIKETATSTSGKRIGILFEDDTSTTLPMWEYDVCKSEEQTDAGYVRLVRVSHLVGETLKLLLEKEARCEDIAFYCSRIIESSKMNYQKAVDTAFGVHKSDLNFAHLDATLKLGGEKREAEKTN